MGEPKCLEAQIDAVEKEKNPEAGAEAKETNLEDLKEPEQQDASDTIVPVDSKVQTWREAGNKSNEQAWPAREQSDHASGDRHRSYHMASPHERRKPADPWSGCEAW